MPLMGIGCPAAGGRESEGLKIGVKWEARHGEKEEKKKRCDRDGLLRSRTAGEHDDCTNVSFCRDTK